MAIAITNLTNTTATAVITAASDIAVTDIIIFNTDDDSSSLLNYQVWLVPSGDSRTVNNTLYDSATAGAGGWSSPIVTGSNIHFNTVTGMIGNKWLLSTGDAFHIQLDDALNLSANWSGAPTTVPVNVFVNYIGL